MRFLIPVALMLSTLSGCALDKWWQDQAHDDCDRNYDGADRQACNDSVERTVRESQRDGN